MEADGGGQGPEDYEIAMVVSAGGLVAWVPAQAMAHNGGRDALDAARLQNAWVPAEAAARTGWIPPPGMLFVEGDHGRAVAVRHGWIHHATVAVGLRRVQVQAAAPRNGMDIVAAVNAMYLASVYLPAHEVIRGHGVCRLWRALADTEAFRRRHRDNRSRTPMPLFLFEAPDDFNLRAVDIRSRVSRPVIRFNPHHYNHEVVWILLISFDDTLYAINPCTRLWASLPPLHVDHEIIGFYATTGPGGFECNVLFHNRQETACAYWIFTMGTAPGQRGIIGLAAGVAYSYELPPVLVLNFLHWLPQDNRRDILRFDTVDEAFSTIPPPSIRVGGQDEPVLGSGRQLFEIDRQLAMTVKCPETARVDVWVRSNTTGLWSCPYRIRLPVDEIDLNGSSHDNVNVFAVAQDRNVLVCCMRVLLQCDALGTVIERYQLADHFTILAGHTIEESLLLHPSIFETEYE